jgi:hypothetical protein
MVTRCNLYLSSLSPSPLAPDTWHPQRITPKEQSTPSPLSPPLFLMSAWLQRRIGLRRICPHPPLPHPVLTAPTPTRQSARARRTPSRDDRTGAAHLQGTFPPPPPRRPRPLRLGQAGRTYTELSLTWQPTRPTLPCCTLIASTPGGPLEHWLAGLHGLPVEWLRLPAV